MVSVVCSFLLASALAQIREAKLEGPIDGIVGNAIPSIQNLSRTRTSLRRVLDILAVVRDVGFSKSRPPNERVFSDIKDMEAFFTIYRTLPFFPNEKPIADTAYSQFPLFEKSVQEFLELEQEPVSTSVRKSLYQQMISRADIIDRTLTRLIEFDSVQSQRLGLDVLKIRTQSFIIVGIFDLLSIGLAILAAIVGIKTLKATVGMLQMRTEELEVFGGRVAHDLKSPLQSIILSSGLLLKPNTDEKRKQELGQRILSTSKRMSEIIDGLFQFAKSGAEPQEDSATDLGSALDRLLLTVLPDAKTQGIQVQVDNFSRPLLVNCPEGVTDSILSNLIRNALKYVDEGQKQNPKIKIHIKDLQNCARVEIEDNGPGIEPGKETAIFQPYIRGSTQKPGIGLGLATVKKFVESYGGRVGVDSHWKEGSTFWFEIPKTHPT